MQEHAKAFVTGQLRRTLSSDPSLTMQEATQRVISMLPTPEQWAPAEEEVRAELEQYGTQSRRRAVLNPTWLASRNRTFHFFLVNSPPGWLRHLTDQTSALGPGASHYILYGSWDALITFCGNKREAEVFHERIAGGTANYEVSYFGSNKTLLYHRQIPKIFSGRPNSATDGPTFDRLVDDYDAPEFVTDRDNLLADGALLGPVWETPRGGSEREVVAFVGISLHGSGAHIDPEQVLNTLREDEILRSCLVHLYMVENGSPYHYFAQLRCASLAELDRATDAIGFRKVGRAALEGQTLIMARGVEDLPRNANYGGFQLAATPDLSSVHDLATTLLNAISTRAVDDFNRLETTVQLVFLQTLSELDDQMKRRTWDAVPEERIRSAVKTLIVATLDGLQRGSVDGAAESMATTVETYLKEVLERNFRTVFGSDFGRVQALLKLPSKNPRTLTIGKAVEALKAMPLTSEFAYLADAVTPEWLARLQRYSELRNSWVHGALQAGATKTDLIEGARRAMVEGIELVRWLGGDVMGALDREMVTQKGNEAAKVRIKEATPGREFSIFVSHSSGDQHLAEKVANAIRAVDFPVWYSDWEIGPGDSVLPKINAALERHDTLIILLSPRSLASKWVQKELNSSLVAQLNGEDILIIPVIVEKCDVPPTLAELHYVDMTVDFQAGILRILTTLRERATRKARK